jgi:hypothetical protein
VICGVYGTSILTIRAIINIGQRAWKPTDVKNVVRSDTLPIPDFLESLKGHDTHAILKRFSRVKKCRIDT